MRRVAAWGNQLCFDRSFFRLRFFWSRPRWYRRKRRRSLHRWRVCPASDKETNKSASLAIHVVKYCKELIKDDNNSDVFAILNCLQTNRSKITKACGQVLAGHGV